MNYITKSLCNIEKNTINIISVLCIVTNISNSTYCTKKGSISTPYLCSIHKSVQYAQLQRSEVVQLCENVQLVHFFQKNLPCFVQGSQYRVFVVQSAESSPKMLKILCNFPKGVLCCAFCIKSFENVENFCAIWRI